MKVCLVGSAGGHLTHLYMLKPCWKDKELSLIHICFLTNRGSFYMVFNLSLQKS